MLPVNMTDLIRAVGYIGVAAIIFAESGLLIGFFLPGDSLLFTAGLLAAQGVMDLRVLVPLCFGAAVVGDAVGYLFGQRVGRRLFQRADSVFFHLDHLVRAERFFARHGGKAVVLARFMPVVRTFTPIVAGAGAMPYRRFVIFNVLGALLWAVGVTVAGYLLGAAVPGIDRYLLPIVLVIGLASVSPGLVQLWRERARA